MEGANYQLVRAGSYIWKAWITPTVLCVDCLSVCVHFPAASGCCGETQHSRNSVEARGVSSWHHVIKTSAAWCLPRVSSANGTLRMTLKPFFFFFQLKQLIVQRGAIRAAQWSLGLKRLKPSSVNLCLIHTKLVAWESDSCEAFWVRSSVSVHVVTIATASRSLTMRVLDILQEEKGIGGTMSFFILFFFVWSIKLITSCLREPWRRTSSPLCDTWSSADVQKLHHRCLLIWWQYFSQLLLF